MGSRAMYPGTFDPSPTATTTSCAAPADIFDRVVVAIAANPGKAPLFPLDKRIELVRTVCRDVPNVEVMGYTGLTVDFAARTAST